jgi:thiamine-phosphate pyrophosphorylase
MEKNKNEKTDRAGFPTRHAPPGRVSQPGAGFLSRSQVELGNEKVKLGNEKVRGYYFITDAGLSKNGNLSDVQQAVAAGVTVVQYRRKDAETRELYAEALALKKICRNRALFIVNDRVDMALAVDADGVHVGQDDLPCTVARLLLGKRKIIGVTVRTLAEAQQAEKDGADHLGVSPIFATTTKPDAGKPAGIVLLEKIRRFTGLPLVAIGGITLENAPTVIAAGADAVCAISAVVTKKDVAGEIRKFREVFSQYRRPKR